MYNYLAAAVSKYKAWKNKRIMGGVLNDSRPVFSSFGDDIYMSDLVNNCIDRIATEISKIEIRSVVQNGSRIAVQNDDITRLFRFQPNPLQTTKDFLACCEWLRRKDMHCFIFPQWEEVTDSRGNSYRRYTAMYPLNPSNVEMGVSEDGVWIIKFRWKDGSEDTLPYSDIIHLRWRRGKNTTVGGGDDNGRRDTKDTLQSVQTFDKMVQGLPLSIEASMRLNGVLTAKSSLDSKKLGEKIAEFEEHLYKSKLGIVALDLAGEFTPLQQRQALIPAATMKFIKDVIRERYGISEAIVSGDYDDKQHAAFFESCLEDAIEEIQQAFSARLFTPREQDVGHRIRCYYNKVEYYSTADKLQLAQAARETGIMTLNEQLAMFGMEPFEGGDRRLQSLNYVNVELIDKYQQQKLAPAAGGSAANEGVTDNGNAQESDNGEE